MITALTHNHGGQVVLHKFFGIDIPVWVHQIIVKALAIIPAIYCMHSAGAEGIYQLLLYCQVILAMLFPASVNTLFRVLSSKWIMGYFKFSWHLEIFASTTFLGILAPSVVFTLDMLFGNSSWMVDLNEYMGNGSILPYILLLLAFIYMGFTLYLAAISLRSANAGPDLQICNLELQKYVTEQSDSREETDSSNIIYEKDPFSAAEITSDEFLECQSYCDNTIFEPDLDPHEAIIGFQNGGHESVLCLTSNGAYASRAFHTDEVHSAVDMGLLETLDELSSCWLDNMGSKDSNKKRVGMEANMQIEKNDKQGGISESLNFFSVSSTSEIPETFKNTRVRGDATSRTDGKVGPSGLSRGGRRQFAAILDEFWGHMFDFHGKLTEEAKAKSVDILLGLESETPSMSTSPENVANVSSQTSSPKAGRGTVSPTTSAEYRSLTEQNKTSDISPYIMQTRFPFLPADMWFLDAESFNKYNDRDVHIRYGSEIPSNDGQTITYQNFVDQLLSQKFDEPYDSYYGDQLTCTLARNGFNYSFKTGFEDPAAYESSRLLFERPYNEPPLVGTSSSSHSTKKYHGMPNVSSLNIFGGSSFLNDTSGTQCDLFSSYPSFNINKYEQSRYPKLISAAKEVPLKFDEYSPANHHKGVFSEPLNMNLDSESLWARPYERHFTTTIKAKNQGDNKPGAAKRLFSYAESEAMILQSLRCCIIKLLKLEESSWLFVQNGGCDEELIDQIAALERIALVQGINKADKMNEVEIFSNFPFLMPDCGDNCIWQASLIVSFGVWCIHRTLELLLVESRPELWGKYTYVLNRLQGILEPAFCKPRSPLIPCKCLQLTEVHENEFQHPKGSPGGCQNTTASLILGSIKNVEAAISGRKGRSGTAAGNIAFPKGKENVASVLKRYKRRLSNK